MHKGVTLIVITLKHIVGIRKTFSVNAYFRNLENVFRERNFKFIVVHIDKSQMDAKVLKSVIFMLMYQAH